MADNLGRTAVLFLLLAGGDNVRESNLQKVVDVDWQWRVEGRFK